VLQIEVERVRFRVASGKATQTDLDDMVEEEYVLAEELAKTELQSNG